MSLLHNVVHQRLPFLLFAVIEMISLSQDQLLVLTVRQVWPLAEQM